MNYLKTLETETAIEFIKDDFQRRLMKGLNLVKISSPIAVLDGTGINDDLNGIERPVSFPVKALSEQRAQVVHSLAKWKRVRISELGIGPGKGIITDMRALRPDEDYSNFHSVYVDQWDWEQTITAGQRGLRMLKDSVRIIYSALLSTEINTAVKFPGTTAVLPKEIKFIHSEELLKMYPLSSAKEREARAAKRYGAIFIIGIGGTLSNGEPHDGRAPDYDDWSTLNEDGYNGLNGDLIVWHPVLNCPLELSSMGIRVDAAALSNQLVINRCTERSNLFYHSLLLNGKLPSTIGGGIGQSRVCMFMLKKRHIGEVQVGIWSEEQRKKLAAEGVELL